jgi:tetratricopeptide (TPR) repeat protein
MGYAYRKLGDYHRALAHYQQALDLNPHHRGALEYLGELYLAMGCLAQANEVLARLETACRRIAGDAAKGDWQTGCGEWQELKAAIDASPGPAPADCTTPGPARMATP